MTHVKSVDKPPFYKKFFLCQ